MIVLGLEDKQVGKAIQLEVVRVGTREGEADVASGPRILQHHHMNLFFRHGVCRRDKQTRACQAIVLPADRRGEDPGAGLLDGQRVLGRDLELNLDGIIVAVLHAVKRLEPIVDNLEVVAELHHLSFTHEELPGLGKVGAGKHGCLALRIQQQLLGIGVRLGVGHQILADLSVDVVHVVLMPNGVVTDGHAVGQFIGEVGMHEHAHRGLQVVYPVVVALQEGPEVPQARPHRLDRLVYPVLGRLIGILRLGVIQPRPVERRKILVVRARPIAQRLPLRVRRVHGLQRVDHPLGHRALLNLLAQRLELLFLLIVIAPEILVGQHLGDIVIEPVGLHELVIEIERHRIPDRHSPHRQTQLGEFRHIGRLDTKNIPIIKRDIR